MRLALGVWRHWLEGSAQPFLVWMDHKNLEYIRSAKRLSSRQASWALFFGRFNFTLAWDSSKNVKPNTLSHQFGAPEGELTAETIHTVPYALLPEVLQRGTSPGWSAIQGFGEHCLPSVNVSGGPHWPQMSESSCWPATLVPNVSLWITLLMVCFILSPSLPVLGHTSPLILSLGSPH